MVNGSFATLKMMFTIAHLTFHEALRKRVLLAAIVLGALFLIVFGVGIYFINDAVIQQELRSAPSAIRAQSNRLAYNFLAMAGLYTVNFLLVMMATLLPVDTLSGEISSGSIQSLVVKPVRRSQIVLGKWLGFAFIMLIYATCMIGGIVGLVAIMTSYDLPNIHIALPIMLLETLLLLTLSIAGGTRFTTLTNGVFVFGMFGLAFIGGWVEQVGGLLGNQAAQNIGVITSLIMPSEALWRLAAHYMQPDGISALNITPFSSTIVPSPNMLLWAIGYTLITLLLAIRHFSQRDL